MSRLALAFLIVLSFFLSNAWSLEIQSHTASPEGFMVNSHLILGEKEAILVDAQFLRGEAQKVADLIRKSGRELKYIYITHGHPDHYFGLEVLRKEFPNAWVLARPGTIQEIRKTWVKKYQEWKPIYEDQITDEIVVPAAFTAKHFALDEEIIWVMDVESGESSSASLLYLPAARQMISGDLIYNQVHLWLAEGRLDAWLENLSRFQRLGAVEIYPGHGPTGDGNLFEENKAYIQDFKAAVRSGRDSSSRGEEMLRKYGDYKLPVILDMSLKAHSKGS